MSLCIRISFIFLFLQKKMQIVGGGGMTAENMFYVLGE